MNWLFQILSLSCDSRTHFPHRLREGVSYCNQLQLKGETKTHYASEEYLVGKECLLGKIDMPLTVNYLIMLNAIAIAHGW